MGAGPAGEDLERLVQAEQTGDRVRELVGVDVGDRPQSATDEQLPVVAEQEHAVAAAADVELHVVHAEGDRLLEGQSGCRPGPGPGPRRRHGR